MLEERPTLIGLSMTDPSASVRDPAFVSLIRDGWTVAAHIPADRNGRQEWVLLMMPPSSPVHSESEKWWRNPAVVLWILVCTNLVFNLLGVLR